MNFEAWKHEPNLLIAEIICKNCLDDPNVRLPCGKTESMERTENCYCGVFSQKWQWATANRVPNNPRLLFFHCFDGGRLIEEFLDFLLYSGDFKTTTICIAHNFGKYDGHLIIDTLFAKGIEPKLTMDGKV